MKNIFKYFLIGVGTVVLEWFFISLCFSFFNGVSEEARVVVGVGFFLAFELVICTGIILSKINKLKEKEDAEWK